MQLLTGLSILDALSASIIPIWFLAQTPGDAKVVTDLGQQVAEKSPAWLMGVAIVAFVFGLIYLIRRSLKRETETLDANQKLSEQNTKIAVAAAEALALAVAGNKETLENYEDLNRQVMDMMKELRQVIQSDISATGKAADAYEKLGNKVSENTTSILQQKMTTEQVLKTLEKQTLVIDHLERAVSRWDQHHGGVGE